MIYNNDISNCNNYAQQSPANFRNVAYFVLATIQQQLETVPAIVSDFVDSGAESKFAFGSKAKGINFLNDNLDSVFSSALKCKNKPAELLALFLTVPGLGLVKAGFLCQLFNNQVGCIDLHNIKLFDIPLNVLRFNKNAMPKTQAAKIANYIALCAGLGGSAFLWSTWCDYLATVRPANWNSGAEVSQFHFDSITRKETGGIVDLFSGIDFEPEFSRS